MLRDIGVYRFSESDLVKCDPKPQHIATANARGGKYIQQNTRSQKTNDHKMQTKKANKKNQIVCSAPVSGEHDR